MITRLVMAGKYQLVVDCCQPPYQPMITLKIRSFYYFLLIVINVVFDYITLKLTNVQDTGQFIRSF